MGWCQAASPRDHGKPAPAGAAFLTKLTEQTAPATRELFSGFDPGDLAVAHRVLTGLTERASRLS